MAEFVSDTLLEKNLSTYDVEERAKRAGYQISQPYINLIKNVYPGNITVPKQKALAAGLGVPAQRISDILNGVTEDQSFEKELAPIYRELPDHRRQDILNIAKMYLQEKRKEEEAGQDRFNPEGIRKEDFQFVSTKKNRKTA